MSVDAEFSNGPFILIDKKMPEVGNSAVACENASSSGTVVLTKETSNFSADTGQKEHNTASEITITEEMSGEAGGLGKGNNDEKLSKESAEAVNGGSSGDKLQCAQSEETRAADTNGGHSELSIVAEIKGVNERGVTFNCDVNLLCKESADTEKVESNGQKTPSTDIKADEEISGESNDSRKNDKSVDAEKGGINSSMAIDPVSETASMEEKKGESSAPHRSDGDIRSSEESADTENIESNVEREPIVTKIKAVDEIKGESNGSGKIDKSMDDEKGDMTSSMAIDPATETVGMEEMRGESSGPHISNGTNAETMRMEPIGCLSSFVQNTSEDNSLSDQQENAGSEDSNGQSAPDMITKIKGINKVGGDSNCDVKLCEGSADTEKVEINCQSVPNTVTEIEEIGSECNGSYKIGKSPIAEKASSNNSLATNIVTEISGIDVESSGAVEGQSNAVEKIDIISEITPIDVGSNGAEVVSNDKLVHQDSTNIEREDSQGQKISNVVGEIKGIEDIEGESAATNKRTDGNSTSEDREDGEVANGSTSVHKGICSDAELSHDHSVLADARLSEVENSFTSISRDMSNNDVIALESEACKSCISQGQISADMVQEIISKAVGGEPNDVDRSSNDKLTCNDFEDDRSFKYGSPAAEGVSCNGEFSQGLSTSVDSTFPEVANYSASSAKEVSIIDTVGAKTEALNSSADYPQPLGSNLIREGSGIENLEGELNGGDNSINNGIIHKKCEDPEKSQTGSDNVGVHHDAELCIDQSVLADVELCEAGNFSASSIKDGCSDVVSGTTLNDPIHEYVMVPNMVTEFTDIKKESESSVSDQTSGDKFIRESEDAEKPRSIDIDERMSCNDEICHNQATSADLELFEAGNTSCSRDASTYKNEALTCPIEVDQELANTSIEIAGTEGMTGGLDRSNDDKLICEQSCDAEISNTNEVLATTSECSTVDVAAARDVNVIAAKGFYFLIRMPRFDDEKIRERIKVAESNVDEKTQHRDAIRQKIHSKRANCQTHGAEFEAAKTQERDARKQVRTKRADISTLQDMIDKAKNAVAIGEIDNRICNMEHIIGHETVPLKEEKLLIREIKQLKQLRGQLSSNIGSQDEVQKSLDERDANEEQLRALKKELDNLKVKVSKAETIAMAASRKFEDESRKLKELQAQFKGADDIRQKAYEELRNLKKGLYEKNVHFRTYKDKAALASEHIRKREMEALNHLCVDQVERYMELWNKNDEFRKDYIRCNMRSTVRRFGTLDGRTLGPDEEPHVLPTYRVERVNRVVASIGKVDSVSQAPVSQQQKQVVLLKDETKDGNNAPQAVERKTQVEKTKEARKPIQRERITVDEPKEAERLPTAQELEAAREEELRKIEEEARLKEQRRLEEIAKAKEALERKKRNAEKAQMRAELRAQKEEEQRLKEKEKRLRKKERKKGVSETSSENNNGETALISTSPRESLKELDSGESSQSSSQTTTKKPQKPSQYTKQLKNKSIPPPLRNKSRKKWQHYLWLIFSCVAVIALFFLGNIGFFSHLKQQPRNPGP